MPAKDSHYASEETGGGSGAALGQYELQNARSFRAYGYPDVDGNRKSSDRGSHDGILVTSNFNTEYSPRARAS